MSEILQSSKMASFRENLALNELGFRADLKFSASEHLESYDFPTTRNEAFKYTRLGKIAALRPTNGALNAHIQSFTLPMENCLTFVFINGRYSHNLSSDTFLNTITIKPLSECNLEELQKIGSVSSDKMDVFNALNTLYAMDGIFIAIPENTDAGKIQIHHILTGEDQFAGMRNFIHCGKFGKAEIVMHYTCENAHNAILTNLTEIHVDENAHVTIDKLQNETGNSFHISSEFVHQEKDSTFSINTLTLNGNFVRNNLNIKVNGTNCTSNLNGAYVLKGQQHVDNHTLVDHIAPHCISNELYKGVIDEKATAVFNGKVHVHKDAQQINAFQSNGNVLLSDDATIYSKPELEIYADDVKCSHGSTTGQLDDEAIFYLRARGLSEKSAKGLLVSAFIGDVLHKIENEAVRSYAEDQLKSRFNWEF